MEIKAKAKYVRMSPRKMRAVADAIRGLSILKAKDQLTFINKLAVRPVSKLIASAIASAEHNFEIEEKNLYIKEIRVNEGPTLKRWKPRARGRATPIRKRTSHVDLILAELVESGKKGPKKQKIEEPLKLGTKPKEAEGVKVSDKDDKEKSEEKSTDDKGKKIIDPRGQGKGKNTMVEGKGRKGFVDKMFRRKSG
ncbi:50S ribosomal protein L22 [Candidatus Parcubacteria bacterium]|nr:50S ribosomal protein L22 [Candidatus Parcubacteria bacterium]